MNAFAFRMQSLSPTKERREFSRGLLAEHRRLIRKQYYDDVGPSGRTEISNIPLSLNPETLLSVVSLVFLFRTDY